MPSAEFLAAGQRERSHFDFLDGMRGTAVAIVFAYHCVGASFGRDRLGWGEQWYPDFNVGNSFLAVLPATFGFSGVALFFVISGFCIHWSHARASNRSVPRFWLRRWFRIYPPYLVALLAFAALAPALPSIAWSRTSFATHVFLGQNFSLNWLYGINPSFWSIAVEFQLYLLYPLIAYVGERFTWNRTLVLTALIEFPLRALTAIDGHPFHRFPPLHSAGMSSPAFYLFSWSLGAWVAQKVLENKAPRRILLTAWPWWVCGLAASLVHPLAKYGFPLVSIGCACYVAREIFYPTVGAAQSNPIARHLSSVGVASYSFYLIHQPIVLALGYALSLKHSPPLLSFALCLSLWFPVLLLAQGLYRLVEVPSARWGKRFSGKKKKDVPKETSLLEVETAR